MKIEAAKALISELFGRMGCRLGNGPPEPRKYRTCFAGTFTVVCWLSWATSKIACSLALAQAGRNAGAWRCPGFPAET